MYTSFDREKILYSVCTHDILRSCPFWHFNFWEYLPKIVVSMATKYWVCMVKILEENVPLTFYISRFWNKMECSK